ncbi:MAG: NAD(P)H-dependent oxidoreductase subunit E [Phycisphaerae bacterium]|nr:NAD(P)H-dependent oxidoreductase subunit E [Phycisphaerae bacterium]
MGWKALNRREKQVGPGDGPVLTEGLRGRIAEFRRQYPTNQSALLPTLLAVQEEAGYVSERAVEEVAAALELAPATVMDTLSFYSHLWRGPKGRHVVMVCRGLSCEVCGGEDLLGELKRKLKIGEHETTADGRFTLITEECMGACEKAPYMLVDGDGYGPVRKDELDGILSRYA